MIDNDYLRINCIPEVQGSELYKFNNTLKSSHVKLYGRALLLFLVNICFETHNSFVVLYDFYGKDLKGAIDAAKSVAEEEV